MTLEPLTDKQIIAKDESARRAIFNAIASFVILLVAAVLLYLAGTAQLIAMWLVNVFVITMLAGWLLLVFTRFKPGIAPPEEAFGEDYWRKTIDLQHRRWRYTIVRTLVLLCYLAFLFAQSFRRPDKLGLTGLESWSFSFIAILAVCTVAFGPGFFLSSRRRALNDELTRAQLARVVQFGYILAIFAMCAVLVINAYEPQRAMWAIPYAVATAIALPGIYFLILEWRASR